MARPLTDRPTEEALNKRAIRLIKRKLCQPLSATIPKCPSKSMYKARKLAASGEPEHMDKRHFCPKCACQKPAGWGTAHYGYGFCKGHERYYKHRGVDVAAEAEKHLAALQAHHPFAYKDTERFLGEVQKSAESAGDILTVREELNLLRATIQEILSRCRPDEKLNSTLFQRLVAIEMAIRNSGLPADKVDRLASILDRIYKRLDAPLTESGRNGPVPISDEKRMRLIFQGAQAVARLSETAMDIESSRFIQVEEVKVWINAVLQAAKKVLDPDSFRRFVQKVLEIPQPKTMYSKKYKADPPKRDVDQ